MLSDDPAERHRVVAATFGDRVEGVADWSVRTPVAAWTALDVVDHLVSWSSGFLAAGGVELAPGPRVGDDPLGAWRHHSAEVQALLDGPRADEAFTHPQVGTGPLSMTIDRFYTADVFLHMWDLARATRQDDTLDERFSAELLAGMEPMDEVLRASGHYGPRIDVPPDASVQDRLIGFIGRDPSWQP